MKLLEICAVRLSCKNQTCVLSKEVVVKFLARVVMFDKVKAFLEGASNVSEENFLTMKLTI